MDFWSQIRALEGKSLRTLADRKPFEVVSVAQNKIVLKISTEKIRTVWRKEIEGAFHELTRTGDISREEIEERHSPRNIAYVAAILAELNGVTYQLGPIRLFYRSK
jgi:hypothetical protein